MDAKRCHYFHPTITAKPWRMWSATGNHWVRCFTSRVFFLISWNLRHRTIVPCNKNTENTLQHPNHMLFSCVNKCQNKYSKEGKEDKCSSIIYIAEWCIPAKKCNTNFLKWVRNQQYIYIYILDRYEERNKFQFVLNEKMHRFFEPLPEANNKRVTLSKETRKKTEKCF